MNSNNGTETKDSPKESTYDHLLVLVHGILSGPSDWRYVGSQLEKRLSPKFLIYASAVNSFVQTLSGIDVAGRRLAEEVCQVIMKYPSLKKISFLCHSLGGLFARYAIAILFEWDKDHTNGEMEMDVSSTLLKKTICGLSPVNFITLATPHLGVRGRKQLPFLFGVTFLEKLAGPVAAFIAGRTGRQLFLMDGKASKPPLLLQMATDDEDHNFLSALGCFKYRACYANVSYDRRHGGLAYIFHTKRGRTTCGYAWILIQRKFCILLDDRELTLQHSCSRIPMWSSFIHPLESRHCMQSWIVLEPPRDSMNGYKHVVSATFCPPLHMSMPSFQPESAEAKETLQTAPHSEAAKTYYDNMEEEMIRGLQQLSWVKVDVSFHEASWPYLAHNHIHVKSEWLYYEGAGVVAHVADSFKQYEDHVFIMANL